MPCQKKRTPWRNLRIAFCYNEGIRNWLHALKNRGELSRLRELRAKDLPAVEDSYDAIISVTSDPQRRRDRLFDWGQVYSSRLAKIWNLPQPRSPFERRPFLSPQKELGRDERLRYLRKLVSLRESPNRTGKKKWKSVLLVDDVMTTGASLEIHAELLKKVADVVDVFCLSRTPLDERIDF